MTVPAPYGDTAHLLAERVAEGVILDAAERLACVRDGCRVCAGVDDWLRATNPRAWLDSLPAPTPGSHESDLPLLAMGPPVHEGADESQPLIVSRSVLGAAGGAREYDNAAAWSRANRKETA